MLLSELVTKAQRATSHLSISFENHLKQVQAEVQKHYGDDVDVEAYLSGKFRAVDQARREAVYAYQTRGEYTKTDVSTPTLPRFSIDYDQADLMVADACCPVVPGSIERKFPKWNRRDSSRTLNVMINSEGALPEVGLNVSFDTYAETGYGAKTRIDNNAVAQASSALDLVAHHGRAIMSDLMMAREVRVATLLTTSGNYVAANVLNLTGNNRWDVGPSTSTANPLKDINITIGSSAALAKRFNTMIASPEVMQYLRQHPAVIAAAGYTASARIVAMAELGQVLGIQNMIVAAAKKDTVGSAAAASYAYVWPKHAAFLYIQPGLSMNELSFCKTFRHTPLSFFEEQERMRGVRGVTWMAGTMEDAEKIVASDAGALITNCIS